MIGIGGGIIIVPVLVFFYGIAQKQAGATSLAVITLPIFLLAVVHYHREGLIRWPFAVALALGMVVGAPLGANLVTSNLVNERLLRIAFGFLLLYVACRYLFPPLSPQRATLLTAVTMLVVPLAWLAALVVGRRSGGASREPDSQPLE
jgi:uncharacterized membrane protein YfcA